ncbi:tyrosine-type recombinase/integrase [Azospirillum sp. YIM B02556]|uniref:Tyrosine-type recombinase/integrase n=1 Tax=Azospirillum endophyticum TaxID=2800326 RepID=A0ABS1FE22_9PROT|nr:VPA1269 family protein [Azospirillum endophyticum]MBK1841654.1 tyrosine-type recombinase/integrase [Azospirillum endophyticum]
MYSWEYVNDANVRLLNEEGTALASESPDKIVVLREVTLAELRAKFAAFRQELYRNIYEVLAMTPAEFSAWHGGDKYDFEAGICPPHSCVAFKRISVGDNKLHWLKQAPVVTAFIDRGHIPAVTPHGRSRKNMVRGGGGAVDFAQGLQLEEQRHLLHSLLFDYNLDLDEIFSGFISQATMFALPELEEVLKGAVDAEEAWDKLSELFTSFMTEQKAHKRRGEAKGDGRHFAAPWFLAYLTREGIVFWPLKAFVRLEGLLPRVLKPFYRTFFVPEDGRALACTLIGPEVRTQEASYCWNVYRELLLTTNFFEEISSFCPDHLLHLKERYHSPEYDNAQKGHGSNLLFAAALSYYGLTHEDIGAVADYFGGRRRLTAEHGRDAFSWVDRPRQHRLRKYKEVFGAEPPTRFPDYVVQWAADLRSLLPGFNVRTIDRKLVELTPWLYWLIAVGEEYAPKTWQEINREKHINSMGNAAYTPYLDFLKSKIGGARVDQCISSLRQAWTLAATRDGFAGKTPCPIDPEIDIVELSDANQNRMGRTRRKALDEFILETLIDENRRPDAVGNPFAFARSLGRFDRHVVDHQDRQKKTVFWPAMPIILDAILNMGMRKIMAQWMDSGEGDEIWVDPETKVEYANPLSTATAGRRMAFLRLVQISNKECVLGSYFPINKSGPYEAPWVEAQTARFFTMMRDWQIRYYPRKSVVLAERAALTRQYAAEDSIPEVYPLFRDPQSKGQAYPPTDGSIYRYWRELLAHCEPIINEKRRLAAEATGKSFVWEPLLIDGKPRWDIHSLRVTTVTTLIESGVSPEIVALLVGHKSVAMTWHYVEVNNRKTHKAIQKGMEERRKRAIADLDALKTEDDIENALVRVLGGIVNLRGDQAQGAELLKEHLISKEPGAYEVFAHGICPGGDCNTGGERFKGTYHPVFRPRACSRCRYRVTGPVFLNGLVHRLNALMIELNHSYEQERDLHARIEVVEDEGGNAKILEGLINCEREARDHIWAEWAAELKTVRQAESMLEQEGNASNLPMVTGMDVTELQSKFKSVHQMVLLHQVVTEADVITGASLEVPPGARAKRDEMLLEIARQNNASSFFYNLAPHARKRALDAFGDLLTHHSKLKGCDELAADHLEALIQGLETMPQLGHTAERICMLASDQAAPIDALEEA